MDGTVVERRPEAAAGEGAAWDGLEGLREGLRGFLVRQCGDDNDVEDVIQETFLRAARYRRTHRVQNLRPWVLRIALNVLADAMRRGVRSHARMRMEDSLEPPDVPEPTPAEACFRVGSLLLDGESARELVLGTLGRLRVQDRTLLDSYYGGEQRTCVSARECGIPRRLVKVRLYRARRRLQRALRHKVALESCWERLAS
jgi:RNA polymerase sigma factor (sigma-70 family)